MPDRTEIPIEVTAKLDALKEASQAFQQLTAAAGNASAAIGKIEAGFSNLQKAAQAGEAGKRIEEMKEKTEGLHGAIEALPNLLQKLGLEEIGEATEKLGGLGEKIASIRTAIAGLSAGGLLATLGGIVGVLGIGVAGAGIGATISQNKETLEFGGQNNSKNIERINELLNQAGESGTLRGEALESLKSRLERLQQLQNLLESPLPKSMDAFGAFSDLITPEILRNAFAGGTADKLSLTGEVSRQISGVLSTIRSETQVSYATENTGAVQFAQQQAALAQQRFDNILALQRSALDRTLADRTAGQDKQLKASEDFGAQEKLALKDKLDAQQQALDVEIATYAALRKEKENEKETVAQIDFQIRNLSRQKELNALQTNAALIASDDATWQRRIQIQQQESAVLRRELQKDADAQRDIRQQTALAEARLAVNPALTPDERAAGRLGLLEKETAALTANIEKWTARAAQLRAAGNLPGAEMAENFVRDQSAARGQNAVGAIQLQGQLDARGFGQSFQAQWAALRAGSERLGDDLSRALLAPLTAFKDGLWSAFETLFQRGATAGQFFGTLARSLGMSFARAVSDMIANWLLSHVIMAGISRLFNLQRATEHAVTETVITSTTAAGATTRVVIRTGEAAHDAAMTGVQVGTHTAGEGTKTGSTFFGALARGAVRVGETIFHGIQVGVRVVTHLIGETLMTAATIAQAAIRMPIILLETLAYVAQAAVKALAALVGIPVIGPFIAPAVAIGILALGAHLAGAFADGGETPGRASLAVVGERGPELVIPAHVNRNLTPQMKSDLVAGRLDRIGGAAGGNAATGGGSDGGSRPLYVGIVDERDQAERWAREKGERFVVATMKKNWHRFA